MFSGYFTEQGSSTEKRINMIFIPVMYSEPYDIVWHD
jgi:hypothetical protein